MTPMLSMASSVATADTGLSQLYEALRRAIEGKPGAGWLVTHSVANSGYTRLRVCLVTREGYKELEAETPEEAACMVRAGRWTVRP